MNCYWKSKFKVRLESLLACGLVSLFFYGCGIDEEPLNNKDENKDRFQFLRKGDENEPSAKRESARDEQVDYDRNAPKISDAQLAELSRAAEAPPKSGGGIHETAPFYENLILLDGDEQLDVSLVFNSAPIVDVIPMFADVLGFNFVIDADLKSSISLNIKSKMSRRDLWNTFDRMLTLAGATVVVNDNILRIMPTTKLAQQPDLSVAAGEESEICYYPLKNMTAKDILIQVKSFLSPNAVCVELTRPNAVLLCDVRTNIPKIKQLLDIIDTNGKNNWPRAVVKCNNILPSQVTEELRTVLPVLGFYVLQSSDKAEQPGSIQLSAIDRLQVIVASAATEEAIKEIRQWVNVLDSSDSLDQERVFVYKVMHGKADQLMQALAVIYNTQGTTLTIDSNTGNDRTTNVNSNNNSNRTTTTTNNRNNPTGNINKVSTTQTDVNSNVFDNQVRIFADGVLNRLVIRTTPRTYASIKALLDRLDVVPAQVLLQVLVVEVTLSESTKFGIEMAASGSANGNLISGGTNYSNLNPYPAEGTTGDSGGKFLISDPDDPESKFLYINALAGDNMIKVISSPQMLVSSHTQAYISVGSEVPYVKSNMTDTSSTSSSGTSIIQDIEYKTTGVTLTVTPQITSNNLISLEIKQELSSVETNTTSKLDSPVFPSRTLETTMTIANGKTMVLGGLIQEKKNDNLNSVPFINKIPYLGRLLGSTESSVERSEILVLVTGHIVNEKSEVEDLIKRYNTALKSLNAFDNELGDNPNAPDRVGDFERRSKGEK